MILDLYLYPFSLTQNEPFLSKKHFGQVDILDGIKFFEILERFVWVKFCQKTFLGKFFSFALVNIADTFVVNKLNSAINILLSRSQIGWEISQ